MPSLTPFRHKAGFGRRIEYWVVGRMLKEGMDVYVPLVDDHAVDAIVRRNDGSVALIQIKARSAGVIPGDAALFSAIPHPKKLQDYWFVFYSERMDTLWILTSSEFLDESAENKRGKYAGERSIWFNGKRRNKLTGEIEEYTKTQFVKYVATDFRRISAGPG